MIIIGISVAVAGIIFLWTNRSVSRERDFYKERCVKIISKYSHKNSVVITNMLEREFIQKKGRIL